jgi:spore maturation protein CgeB
MGEPFLGPMRENFLWSESLQPMVDRFSDLVAADRSTAATTNLVKACNTAGYEVPFKDARNQAWFWSYCIHTASMKQRRKAVNAAIPAGIELFGDPEGWRRLLGNRVTLHPSVDYQSQLASTYAAIDVNLNSTSCQMPTAVNQRVFDIPLAGSFVLSDNQPDLFELFEESSEVIVYHDPQEIPSLAAYYQQHPERRRAISARAKQRIVAEHTYAKRLERLLSTV